jgi:AbrB family looped-hinge helix DNA binding protein
MSTTLTVKGQVTIPKTIRDAMGLTPGTSIDFAVNQKGEVVLQKAAKVPGARNKQPPVDRFEAARGKADVTWKTQELMALLRG